MRDVLAEVSSAVEEEAPRESAQLRTEHRRVAELYRSLGPAIYRRCLKMLKTREAARDATQEVFMKLLRRGCPPDPEGALRWVYAGATYYCLTVRRDNYRKERKLAELDVDARFPEITYPERQLTEMILARFDAKTQAIAVGILVDGMGKDELAKALGVSSKTVLRRLKRFLFNARKFIERHDL